jgi:hypothetical protein
MDGKEDHRTDGHHGYYYVGDGMALFSLLSSKRRLAKHDSCLKQKVPTHLLKKAFLQFSRSLFYHQVPTCVCGKAMESIRTRT